jgi:D-alanine-D-alanine ligase
VTTLAALREQVAFVLEGYGGPALIEEFCEGEEFTVGIIGNASPRVVGVMQIRHRTLPADEFLYSLEVKRDWENQVEYLVPPPVAAALLSALEKLALGCYRALGCRDVSRVDLRLKGGVPHFIEVNPLPGLSPTYGDCRSCGRMLDPPGAGPGNRTAGARTKATTKLTEHAGSSTSGKEDS